MDEHENEGRRVYAPPAVRTEPVPLMPAILQMATSTTGGTGATSFYGPFRGPPGQSGTGSSGGS